MSDSPHRRLGRFLAALDSLADTELAAARTGDWPAVIAAQQRTVPVLDALNEVLAGLEITPDLASRHQHLYRRRAETLRILERRLAETGERRTAVTTTIGRLEGMRRAYGAPPAPAAGFRQSA